MAEAVLNIDNDILNPLGHMKIGEESPGTNKATLVAPTPLPPPKEFVPPKQRGPPDENQLQSTRQLLRQHRRRTYLQRKYGHHQTTISLTSTSISTKTDNLSPYHNNNCDLDNNQCNEPGHCEDLTYQKNIDNNYNTKTGPCPNTTDQHNTVNKKEDNGHCLNLTNHNNTTTSNVPANTSTDTESTATPYLDYGDFGSILKRFAFSPNELQRLSTVLGTIYIIEAFDFQELTKLLTYDGGNGPRQMSTTATLKIEYIYFLTKYKGWRYEHLH